jgi:uncharacterized protein YqfA (UPF0365 family)
LWKPKKKKKKKRMFNCTFNFQFLYFIVLISELLKIVLWSPTLTSSVKVGFLLIGMRLMYVSTSNLLTHIMYFKRCLRCNNTSSKHLLKQITLGKTD